MLVKAGGITKIDEKNLDGNEKPVHLLGSIEEKNVSYFVENKTGITFNENELISIDPNECEPWEYANRLEGEMGAIDELVDSIRKNNQLQPALVRPHSKPHGIIKYEVIFGRRRQIACLKLGIPLLAIKKDFATTQEAIAIQDAENRYRNDISNYSNALLYKKLLENGVFKEEKDLAQKLHMATSSLSELMAYTKIPDDIINLIPDIHSLSNNMALKIVSILKKTPKLHNALLNLSPKIGVSITSPEKLEKALQPVNTNVNLSSENILYTSSSGTKLFTLKNTPKGVPSLLINKEINDKINYEDLCSHLKKYFERAIT